jgi:hypothetical protein
LSTIKPRAALVRDLGNRLDVQHIERRVGRALQEAGLGVRLQCALPLIESSPSTSVDWMP